jgi:hypothetical protein
MTDPEVLAGRETGGVRFRLRSRLFKEIGVFFCNAIRVLLGVYNGSHLLLIGINKCDRSIMGGRVLPAVVTRGAALPAAAPMADSADGSAHRSRLTGSHILAFGGQRCCSGRENSAFGSLIALGLSGINWMTHRRRFAGS